MLTEEKIQEIARREAHNVAENGGPGAEEHNTKTIAHAITTALEEAAPYKQMLDWMINNCSPDFWEALADIPEVAYKQIQNAMNDAKEKQPG